MIQFEGFDGVRVEIIGEEALEASLAKAFGDSTGTGEQVDGLEIHG